jgi:glucosylceramidase
MRIKRIIYHFVPSRFLKAYEQNGIKMWGLTTQNEPIDGLIPFFPFNAMGWTPYMQRDWIKNNLGPTLHENGFEKLKIMILDDSTLLLNSWTRTVWQAWKLLNSFLINKII